jgi:hypothetical protein
MHKIWPVLLLAVLALAGCGATDSGSGEDETTPTEAVAEIATIKTMLERARTQYRAGDADAADETVGDAYLDHFEEVEEPLGERDHELMEELEHRISTEIRDEMKAGAARERVSALIDETTRELDRAVAALQE